MKIKEIMTTDVECTSPRDSLKDAAVKMKDLDVGYLPVGDDKGLYGVLTDRDIVIRGIAQGVDLDATQVEQAMTPKVSWCFDDEDLIQIAEKMKGDRIRRMIVIDHDKQLAGVVSLGNISVRGDQNVAEDVLEKVSEPSRLEGRI